MHPPLDSIMERATQALTRMDYLACERYCLEALAMARLEGDWPYYARILLPLQEARRQRRMIAAGHTIRLGTAAAPHPETWPDTLQAGCLLVSRPHTPDHARALDSHAHAHDRAIEVLYLDNTPDDVSWTLRAFSGPAVTCPITPPPPAWRDRWLAPGQRPDPGPDAAVQPGATPADWFLDAAEALGDAALNHVTAEPGTLERLEQLEAILEVVRDHEIIHQRLGDAARALAATPE